MGIPTGTHSEFGWGSNDNSSGHSAGAAAAAAVAYGGGEYGGGGGSQSSGGSSSSGGKGGGFTDPTDEPDPDDIDPGGDDGGGGSAKPIVLDLDGDGVELVALDDSTAFYDINGDGYRERMAWASADDGFLAYDKDGDGAISAHDELSFVSYVEGAQTDLEGLAHFDTNDDGVLDAQDAEWSKFRVWQDLDQDGVSDPGELRTLDEAGITEISLTSDGIEQTVAGNTVFGEGSYTDGDGSRSFFDAALQYSGWGIREDADGNIIVGSGDDANLHIAGPTTEAERRLDAATLGVAGIIGHDTVDHLTAAPEGSLLVGAAGDDTLVGGAGDDWLQGDGGADVLRGGGGSDILIVDADDFATGEVDGGAGFDVAIVSGDTGVTVNLAAHGLEAILGAGGNDTFSTSGSGGVVMFGEAGADTLTGGAGDDLLSGGAGADTLRGGDGDDTLFVDADDFATGAVDGGAGRDIAFVEGDTGVTVDLAAHNLEMLFGSEGDDTLSTSGAEGVLIDGGAGDDTIAGSAANDSLFGSAGDDTVTGGRGNDILDGGAGADTLRGGTGNDLYRFGRGGGRDTVRDEHIGTRTWQERRSRTRTRTVSGWIGSGEDQYWGSYQRQYTEHYWVTRTANEAQEAGAADMLFLHGDIGIGDILLRLTAGGLEIALKDPDDPDAAFDDLADRVTIENWSNNFSKIETIAFGDGSRLDLRDLVTTYNVTVGGAVVDLIAAMTAAYTGAAPTGGSAYLGGAGDDGLVGGAGDDVVSGGTGNDTMSGGDGDDTLDGGAGSDVLWGGVGDDALKGGAGNDLYRFGRGDGRDTVRDEHIGTRTWRERTGSYTAYRYENVTYDSGEGNYYTTTQRVAYTAYTYTTRTAEEAQEAGAADVLYLHGDIGIGDILLRLTADGLEIALKDPDDPDAAFDDLADRVTIENWSNDFSKIEVIAFGDGSRLDLRELVTTYNVTAGGPVVDLIAAMTAAYAGTVPVGGSAYLGGAGDERLVGGDTDDVVSGGGGDDILSGGEGDDTLLGGYGNDILSGGDGDDTLEGGAGDDVLWGGADNDALKGGAGDDRYSFGRGDGRDTVRDEHLVNGQAAEAGTGDVLYLHGEIGIADVKLRIVDGNLEIALKDPDDPDAAFDDLADRVTIENWSNDFSKIELLAFGDGSRLDLKEIVDAYGVTDGGAVVDLIAAIMATYAGTVPEGGKAYVGGSGSDTLYGGAGDDVLLGGSGSDALYGGDGDDVLLGGTGRDYLYGGDGEDTASYAGSSSGMTVNLTTGRGNYSYYGYSNHYWYYYGDRLYDIEHLEGSDHNDTLTGNNLANRLSGGSGGDYLYGGSGDDVLHGGSGGDVLYGGAGEDTASYTGSSSGVTVSLASGTGAGGDAAGDTLAGIEHLEGSDHDDTLTGNTGANRLAGGAGADRLYGGSGDDVLHGGSGGDYLYGGAGEDTASYTGSSSGVTVSLATGTGAGGDASGDTLAGIEHLEGSDHDDTLTGDTGANRLAGGAGADSLYGGAGDDVLRGGAGGDALYGGDGDDVLHGGAGSDTLEGGAGEDTASYTGSSSGVTVSLATGTGAGGDAEGDTLEGIEHLEGSDHADSLTGDTGANRLAGGAGDDTLEGGAGDDVLHGGTGSDILSGGDGEDTASYAGSSSGVNVSLWSGLGYYGDASGDRLYDIEHLEGSDHNDTLSGNNLANRLSGGSGADNLYGGRGDDALYGGSGTDRLYGHDDDDVLHGGSGGDYLYGGDGDDTASYAGSSSGVNVSLWSGLGYYGDASGDRLYDIEHLEGSDHNDTLSGNNLANRLSGGSGADNLYGGRGDDALYGGSGTDRLYGHDDDDVLHGGSGGDYLYGGAGEDTASWAGSSSGVNVSLGTGRGYYGDASGDWLYDIEHLVGSDHDDTLTGDTGANRLAGGAGDDTLSGGAGDDVLRGGAGADTLEGGAGEDTASYTGSASGVTVSLASGTGAGGDAEGDTLAGIEHLEGSDHADTLTGDTGANRLAGGAGDDSLYGGDGDDVLRGGAGADSLHGGAGDDIYEFGRGDGADIIDNRGESGSDDVLEFDSGIDADQLWFGRSDDDLVIRIIGTDDSVTIEDWYHGTDNRLDFELGDGSELAAENVHALVDAMAAFTQPGAGETEFTPAQHTALDSIVAANWQTPS